MTTFMFIMLVCVSNFRSFRLSLDPMGLRFVIRPIKILSILMGFIELELISFAINHRFELKNSSNTFNMIRNNCVMISSKKNIKKNNL